MADIADILVNIPGLTPAQGPELGDTIFEAPGSLGVVDEANLITLNLGPQHPSTHGVFRLVMQLQGETVISAIPVMGYLHRSSEKLGEARTYVQGTVLTDRMDYLSPITTNWAYALSIERLTGLVVPERAEFLRVITGELSRTRFTTASTGTCPFATTATATTGTCCAFSRCARAHAFCSRRWTRSPKATFVPRCPRCSSRPRARRTPASRDPKARSAST